MKTYFALLPVFGSLASACIQVHAWGSQDLPTGANADTLSFTVWDAGKQVCTSEKSTVTWENNQKVWSVNDRGSCSKGYEVTLKNRGLVGEVTNRTYSPGWWCDGV